MGARNWGWGDVLPTFQAMTDDRDAAGPERNVRGPNIVRRLPRASWPAYMQRLEEVLAGQGMPSHANIYDTDQDGFFPTPLSQDHERATGARCYLTAEARARPNLAIMCDTRVLRILFDGQRVTGILAERAGARTTIAAREVVVSAGGIRSPAVLLRSGIGPAEDLRKLGIAVVADRRGVGRYYQNHPQLHFAMPLKPGTRMPASAQHIMLPSGLDVCHRRRKRSDGGGRSTLPRVWCCGTARRRCLGDAENRQRQHKHADDHDCGAGRRIHAQSSLTIAAARP
jgi:choline dehydrogenase-like flavoprotein